MSTLTSLARAEAARAGIAQPVTTVRHTHIHTRPLVFIPLTLAGESNAPLAAMVGDDRSAPRLLFVTQPRNRAQRFAFAAELAGIIVGYIDSFATGVEAVAAAKGEIRVRYADAPQVIVPGRGGLGFVGLFGRSTRFRRTDGEYAVEPPVPLLGRWLTFLAERAEQPGTSLLIAATDALAAHWATGQSAAEDQNLAALTGWIDPPAGLTGPEAAALAEDPSLWPPAGPATDPEFDNKVLAPLIEAGDTDGMRAALTGQLEPAWNLVWHAIDLLARLPEGASVASRWAEDRDAYTAEVTYVRDVGLPQPRRDGAVAAARRLGRLERAQTTYAAQRAFDDPLVFAEYRMTGEAFAGTVTGVVADRVVGEGRTRKLRPHVTVTTPDPVRLSPGTVVAAASRPGQNATVVSVDGDRVLLELTSGMGRALVPEPGTVPAVGEAIAYTSLAGGYQSSPVFPVREETPWTHGGPPPEYAPDAADAIEEWS